MKLLASSQPSPPVQCRHCGEQFREVRDLSLHRGRIHPAQLGDGEQASFEAALEEEERWLARFRQHMRASLAILPVMLVYAIVLLAGSVYAASTAFMLLPLPGIVGFAALTYVMVYHHQSREEESAGEGDPPA